MTSRALAFIAIPLRVLFVAVIAAGAAHAQTPTATLTQWDIFTATGANGVAGPAGAVWFTGQNADVRIGRLDPSATVNNYSEWRPAAAGDPVSGAPLGLALNPTNGDLWVAIQGSPSLLLKPAGSNTLRRFGTESALTPQGIAVAANGSLYMAVDRKS